MDKHLAYDRLSFHMVEAFGEIKSREYMRQWKEKNPHLVSMHEFYRRKSAANPADAKAIRAIYKLAKSAAVCACYLCGRLTFSASERQVDHKQPVCREGGHTASNLAIACCDCNLRKHAKTEFEFLSQEHVVEKLSLEELLV